MEDFAKWKHSRFKADANKVALELEALGEEVTPEAIVIRAQDDSSELHKCFTWDDTEAAQKWRIQEARHIMCELVYVPKKDDSDAAPIRLYYKTDNLTPYKSTRLILRNDNEYESLMKRAISELNAFKTKYNSLVELNDIVSEVFGLN